MLADAGFDIAHEFDTAVLAADPAFAAVVDPALRVGVLVGNTRALWPIVRPLVAGGAPDPIEHYTEATIARAFPGAPTWFSHRRYAGAFLPFQRIAVAAGLGALAPTQLVIHPRFGPWFALRALVIRAGDPPPTRALPPYRCTGDCELRLAAALASTGDWRAWLAVRDACTVGRDARYSDEQLTYHYTHNRGLIVR